MYYVLLGLVVCYDLLGSKTALQTADRLAAFITQRWGDQPGQFPLVGPFPGNGHDGGEGTLILEPIVLVGQRTGNAAYIAWAEASVARWDEWWAAYPVANHSCGYTAMQEFAAGAKDVYDLRRNMHAHTYHMTLLGIAALANATGKQEYRDVVVASVDRLAEESDLPDRRHEFDRALRPAPILQRTQPDRSLPAAHLDPAARPVPAVDRRRPGTPPRSSATCSTTSWLPSSPTALTGATSPRSTATPSSRPALTAATPRATASPGGCQPTCTGCATTGPPCCCTPPARRCCAPRVCPPCASPSRPRFPSDGAVTIRVEPGTTSRLCPAPAHSPVRRRRHRPGQRRSGHRSPCRRLPGDRAHMVAGRPGRSGAAAARPRPQRRPHAGHQPRPAGLRLLSRMPRPTR